MLKLVKHKLVKHYPIHILLKTSSMFCDLHDKFSMTIAIALRYLGWCSLVNITSHLERSRGGQKCARKGPAVKVVTWHGSMSAVGCSPCAGWCQSMLVSWQHNFWWVAQQKCQSELINRSSQSHAGLIRSCCFSLHSCESSRGGLTNCGQAGEKRLHMTAPTSLMHSPENQP